MEIDRKTLKALAADTRLDILKSLGKRRKTPSELSKEMGLATSTIVEHLSRLEEASLIRKEETGHKWIYYKLTEKGSSLVRPKQPVQFIIIVSLGILFVFSGIYRHLFAGFQFVGERALQAPMATAAKDAGEAFSETVPSIDWIMVGLLTMGIALIAVGIISRVKKK